MSTQVLVGLITQLGDPALTEILVNGTRSSVRCYVDGTRAMGPSPFASVALFEECLQEWAFAQQLRLDPLAPAVGGEWSTATAAGRWHAVLPPLAAEGPLLSLRRHRFEAISFQEIQGSLQVKACLERAWHERVPLFIIGPTGSGKTTLLMALLKAFSMDERVIFLERTAELPLLSPAWIRLVEQRSDVSGRGAFGLQAALEETLRLKPDRLVLGEMRGAEAAVGWQALLVGEGGFVSTLHVASPRFLALRFAQLLAEKIPWRELFEELRPAVVQMARANPARLAAVHPWDAWKDLLLLAE